MLHRRGRVLHQPPHLVHHIRGAFKSSRESQSSFEGENLILEEGPNPSFEGENPNTNDDSDVQSEVKDVNAKLDPTCDPNYPPLTKWTRDHPITHVIGESSSGVLTRAQQKAKQTKLFSKVEYCILNSFISKIEPKNLKSVLDHSD